MVKNELRSWMLTLCMLSISGTVQAQQASLPPEVIAYADMVFYNGKIITADDQHSVVSAVAIRDGKFLAVGNDDRILRLSGPRTQKIDLQGKSVVPGFIDNHKHGAWVGNVHKRGFKRPDDLQGQTERTGRSQTTRGSHCTGRVGDAFSSQKSCLSVGHSERSGSYLSRHPRGTDNFRHGYDGEQYHFGSG